MRFFQSESHPKPDDTPAGADTVRSEPVPVPRASDDNTPDGSDRPHGSTGSTGSTGDERDGTGRDRDGHTDDSSARTGDPVDADMVDAGADRGPDGTDLSDGRDDVTFVEPVPQETAFGAATVGGAVAASEVAARREVHDPAGTAPADAFGTPVVAASPHDFGRTTDGTGPDAAHSGSGDHRDGTGTAEPGRAHGDADGFGQADTHGTGTAESGRAHGDAEGFGPADTHGTGRVEGFGAAEEHGEPGAGEPLRAESIGESREQEGFGSREHDGLGSREHGRLGSGDHEGIGAADRTGTDRLAEEDRPEEDRHTTDDHHAEGDHHAGEDRRSGEPAKSGADTTTALGVAAGVAAGAAAVGAAGVATRHRDRDGNVAGDRDESGLASDRGAGPGSDRGVVIAGERGGGSGDGRGDGLADERDRDGEGSVDSELDRDGDGRIDGAHARTATVSAVPIEPIPTPADAEEEPATVDEPVELLPGDVPEQPALATFFSEGTAGDFRDRWREVQLRFVDDPRQAASDAGTLVDEVVSALNAAIAEQRKALGGTPSGQGDTEQLRVLVRRQRDFLDRILGL